MLCLVDTIQKHVFLSKQDILNELSPSVHGRAAAMATLHYLIKNAKAKTAILTVIGPDDLPLTWLKDAATAIIDALTTDRDRSHWKLCEHSLDAVGKIVLLNKMGALTLFRMRVSCQGSLNEFKIRLAYSHS